MESVEDTVVLADECIVRIVMMRAFCLLVYHASRNKPEIWAFARVNFLLDIRFLLTAVCYLYY